MILARSPKTLLFLLLFGYFGYAISGDAPSEASDTPTENADNSAGDSDKPTEDGDKPTKDDDSTEDVASVGDSKAGEERYKKSCINCHGAAGKGVASYPKISGKEISHTKTMLETYREGIKVGPNSSLMIMMAKPLTDEEIANLAAYLKDATP